MKREEKKKLTRTNILTTAEALFARNGIKSTDIRDIAAKSNVSVVTFYKYFPSKEELLTQITISKARTVSEIVKSELAQSNDDLFSTMSRIDKLIDNQVEINRNSDFEEFLDIAFFSNPEVITTVEAITKEIVKAVYLQLKKTDQLQPGVTLEALSVYADMLVQYTRLPKNRGNVGPHHKHQHSELDKSILNILLYGVIKQPQK